MNIKPFVSESAEIDVSEWNDEIKAYLKPLNGFEALVFNDLFLEFYSKQRTPEERYEAGFKAALIGLVDETGAPLLAETDREAVRAASFVPFYKMFNASLAARNGKVETVKKK